ncbi:hypothetical protein, partial [Thermoleptolyngbya sp.]
YGEIRAIAERYRFGEMKGDRREMSVLGDEGRSPSANTSIKRMEQRFWLRPRAGDRGLSSLLEDFEL